MTDERLKRSFAHDVVMLKLVGINPEHELKMKDLHKKPEMPLKGGI